MLPPSLQGVDCLSSLPRGVKKIHKQSTSLPRLTYLQHASKKKFISSSFRLPHWSPHRMVILNVLLCHSSTDMAETFWKQIPHNLVVLTTPSLTFYSYSELNNCQVKSQKQFSMSFLSCFCYFKRRFLSSGYVQEVKICVIRTTWSCYFESVSKNFLPFCEWHLEAKCKTTPFLQPSIEGWGGCGTHVGHLTSENSNT